MIIDIYFFRIETVKINKNTNSDSIKKYDLFENLIESSRKIHTQFLTKCLISLCINTQDRDKYISKFFCKNNLSNEYFHCELIIEPTNILLLSLNKIIDFNSFKLLYDFFNNYFRNSCDNKNKLKNNDLVNSIFSENSTCQIFYSFLFLNQSFIDVSKEMELLQNIFDYLISCHKKPFCFEVTLLIK